MMRYYPVNLDIRGRRCLVVGGGPVGARKISTLVRCGAVVTVVSPKIVASISKLVESKTVAWMPRSYQTEDTNGMFLVIGATDDEALNRRIHADAESRNVLCNIADRPAICNFTLPAIVERGDFVMAISTAGKSPAFAKHIRQHLETQFGPEYGALLDLMGAIRTKLLAEAHEPEAHKPLFESLIAGDLLALVKANDIARIDQLLEKVLGPDYRYDQLLPIHPNAGE